MKKDIILLLIGVTKPSKIVVIGVAEPSKHWCDRGCEAV